MKRALVRQPSKNFAQGITTSDLGVPDYELALAQHKSYIDALRMCGLDVCVLDADERFPDGCFVEDTTIIVGEHAVLTNPGHVSRQDEPASISPFLQSHKKLLSIKGPGTLDGGDVLRIGNHLYIGLTARTNQDGAEQLAAIAHHAGLLVSTIALDRYLHLKTAVTCVDSETLIGTRDMLEHEEFRSFNRKLIVAEQELHAANCLSVNGSILVPSDCTKAQTELRTLGKNVIPISMSEFRKMDGGLSCLSILF